MVLTIVAGAVRRFLKERHARVDGQDFRVVIPVNLRSESDGMEVPGRVSAWFLSLPLAERDPLRRFAKIRAETRRLERSRAAQGIDLLGRLAEWTGSDLLTFWGVRLASTLRPYNLIVSNVHGPNVPLYLLGALLTEFTPMPPLFENQGLALAAMSYCGRLQIGAIGDRTISVSAMSSSRPRIVVSPPA